MNTLSGQGIIVVGNGLAGCLLAWTLLQQGKKVHIFAGDKACASRVAAGLINPVTGQRFVLAEQTPEMLNFAHQFYHHIENTLNVSFFHTKTMFRLFNSQKEQENCKNRLKNNKYKDYLKEQSITTNLKQEHGSIVQTHTAWLDTNTLLDALHTYFKQQNIITYRNVETTHSEQTAIYCEGYHMMSNPLFSWLPLQPAHGEIITCNTENILPDAIINKSKWLLPMNKKTCRIGATFDTKITTPTQLETSKQQLLAFANGLFHASYNFKVTQHQAGIRPTTLDKQPFIGFHPKQKNTAIFNGFGSRGSLLIPWYSHLFTQSLLTHDPIPAKVDISRYSNLLNQ
ncbi:NAD(P)/FAD-dependent oxidoreductase [Ghiorsea bivora]|uniref:NAD(P)/FAD-dependent oxidoreductase n=1 Tax=Ghiorsea bivora TaxID=1485545 RepID=UPI000570BD84|nr:FAD-dependent oxidoreductase [Ghiorsea bivora]